MPRSLPETRQIIGAYSGGPILKTAAEDALWYAERFRDLCIDLRAQLVKCPRDAAAKWVDDQAG